MRPPKRSHRTVVILADIYARRDRFACPLYALLSERTPEQSISHTHMPSFAQHIAFIDSRPYTAWYEILADGKSVGSIYLSKQREIGVAIFRAHQRKGYGRAAVLELMSQRGGRFLANINPKNEASIKLWESLGFTQLQVTYQYDQAIYSR